MNQEVYNLMTKSLKLMKDNFTSFEFAKKCRELGVPKRITSRGDCASFLKAYAVQTYGSRTWTKNIITPDFVITEESFSLPPKELTESECIKFLLKKGYRILKMKEPVWEDIK